MTNVTLTYRYDIHITWKLDLELQKQTEKINIVGGNIEHVADREAMPYRIACWALPTYLLSLNW